MADPLVLINAFEVPRGDAEQFIAAWEKTRDYLSAQPGYVDTALHQAVTPNADLTPGSSSATHRCRRSPPASCPDRR